MSNKRRRYGLRRTSEPRPREIRVYDDGVNRHFWADCEGDPCIWGLPYDQGGDEKLTPALEAIERGDTDDFRERIEGEEAEQFRREEPQMKHLATKQGGHIEYHVERDEVPRDARNYLFDT